MLKLSIFNQRLSYFSDSEVVADSKGYLVFTLETSEDWANYVGKTVQFTRNGVTYSVTNISDNVKYAVPWEVLRGAGIMYVNAFAVQATGKRATTNQIAVEIISSGLNEDSLAPTDPTPDIFQQYVDAVQEDTDRALEAANKAQDYAQQTLDYRNDVQQIKQESEQIKLEVESLNQQVQNAANAAFESANAAENSAQAASASEINAAKSEQEAKIAAQEAKQSETNTKQSEINAKQSETNAVLEADRAEANQIIVTQTKTEIDDIHTDIQNRHTSIIELNNNVNEKSEQVDLQTQQVQEWYDKFVTGSAYIYFENTVNTDTEDGGDWDLNADGSYSLPLSRMPNLIMNVQVYENGNYYITNLVDIRYIDNVAYLYSLFPFKGRVTVHALVTPENIQQNVAIVTDVLEHNGSVDVYKNGIVANSINVVKSVENIKPINGDVSLFDFPKE